MTVEQFVKEHGEGSMFKMHHCRRDIWSMNMSRIPVDPGDIYILIKSLQVHHMYLQVLHVKSAIVGTIWHRDVFDIKPLQAHDCA